MSELLQPDQIVQSRSGQPCKVVKFLDGNGQGEVYRAQWAGGDFALKWYYEHTATAEQRSAIEALIDLPGGRPSSHFLWPEDLAEAKGVPGFGYIMRLREPRYKSLTDLVAGRIEPTFLALITAGLELTKAFRSLHTKGLCYRDISFGNAFFDHANPQHVAMHFHQFPTLYVRLMAQLRLLRFKSKDLFMVCLI